MMKRLMLYLRTLWWWLWELWPLWGAVAITCLVMFVSVNLDDRIRYTGMCLEIFSIGTVAYGLYDKVRIFELDGPIKWLRQWVQRFPRWPKSVTVILTGVAAAGSAGSAQAFVQPEPTEKTVQDRLKELQEEVKMLKHALTQVQMEVTRLGQEIEGEKVVRAAFDKKIHGQLHSFAGGSLHIEAVGIICLIVGVVFATAPGEIAWLVESIP
jgi:hypothetical protein